MQLCFGYSQYMNISARTTEGTIISKHHHVNTTHVYAGSPAWGYATGHDFFYFRIMQFQVFRLLHWCVVDKCVFDFSCRSGNTICCWEERTAPVSCRERGMFCDATIHILASSLLISHPPLVVRMFYEEFHNLTCCKIKFENRTIIQFNN